MQCKKINELHSSLHVPYSVLYLRCRYLNLIKICVNINVFTNMNVKFLSKAHLIARSFRFSEKYIGSNSALILLKKN